MRKKRELRVCAQCNTGYHGCRPSLTCFSAGTHDLFMAALNHDELQARASSAIVCLEHRKRTYPLEIVASLR